MGAEVGLYSGSKHYSQRTGASYWPLETGQKPPSMRTLYPLRQSVSVAMRTRCSLSLTRERWSARSGPPRASSGS